jgi:uncharacterized membrane protein YphA (DoxX/SURF4 family)
VGLLLLRGAAGSAVAGHGAWYVWQGAEPATATFAIGLLAILSGAGLIAGFFTPGAAVLGTISTLVIAATWTRPVIDTLLMDRAAVALVVVDAVALALLGPGAHSVDAYLFGRREIILPGDSSER